MKNASLLLLLWLYLPSLWAQKNIKMAEKAFRKSDYYSAQQFYAQAFKDKEDEKLKPARKARSYYQMGQSCRIIYLFAQAENYYRKCSELGEERLAFPDLDFYYAYTLKHNGKYSEAKIEFENFLTAHASADEPQISKLIPKARQEAGSCDRALELIRTEEKGLRLQALSKNVNTQYSDFAPHEVGNELYFSSLKFERQFRGRRDPNESKEKSLVGKILSSKDKGLRVATQVPNLNIRYQSSGNSSISPDGQRLFFTFCQNLPNQEVRCAIYTCVRKGNRWDDPIKLPATINEEKFTSTHPYMGFDSLQNAYFLYFVSNREGGQGDMDIWRSRITLGDSLQFAPAENLGASINSVEAEVTPFFHTSSQTLYFSSKWHYGLGGFDMFKARQTSPNQWTTPINLGVPLNTAANDIYFWISSNDTTAYLASNRTGSKTLVGESCCNDIYAVNLPQDFVKTPPDWLEPSEPIVAKVDSPQIDSPKTEPVLVKVDSSKTQLVITRIDSPKTEPIVVKVDSPKTEPIIAKIEPNRPPTLEELNAQLPIILFFHNDEPDPKSTASVTEKTYAETYDDYRALQPEYLQTYGQGFADNEAKLKANADINQFFADMETEFEELEGFLAAVQRSLESGSSLEIQLKGFASPRASKSYNKRISSRRVSCFLNHVQRFQNGGIDAFIRTGQLKISLLPMGEDKAAANVASELQDKNSIYSPAAMKERRVEISVVKLN